MSSVRFVLYPNLFPSPLTVMLPCNDVLSVLFHCKAQTNRTREILHYAYFRATGMMDVQQAVEAAQNNAGY